MLTKEEVEGWLTAPGSSGEMVVAELDASSFSISSRNFGAIFRISAGVWQRLKRVIKMRSFWSDETTLTEFPALHGDINTDILVIGGGIAGLLCAYLLKESGVNCVLVEAEKICSGITKNTTGKITSQHGLIYHKLWKKYGTEKSKLYLQANEEAIQEYARLAKKIPCAFEEKSAYVYCRSNEQKLEQEQKTLEEIGYRSSLVSKLSLPFPVAGAIEFSKQAQIQPLEFLNALAQELCIYENTKVQEIQGLQALTDRGKIAAKKIIVATHFPFLNKHGSFFLKLYQQRSYVLGLKNAPNVQGMYIDGEKNGLSFRNYKDFLLLGGGGHRTGKQGGNWKELERLAAENYPGAEIVYRWATQDCMSLDAMPYIGQYSKNTPGLYVTSGYSKWGMTGSMVSAMLLRDQVMDRENIYSALFSPSRTMLHPQLVLNGIETTKNLLTFSEKRCPHLGCALKWNPQERSWDCPCHGSRFTEQGQLIDNPATGDLEN